MTSEELAAIKARAEAASPGPWQPESEKLQILKEHAYSVRIRRADGLVLCDVWNWTHATHDVEFIAHARTDVPQLIAEVERLHRVSIDRIAESAAKILAERTPLPIEDWRNVTIQHPDGAGYVTLERYVHDLKAEVELLRAALHGAADVMPAEKFRAICHKAGMSDAETKAIFLGQGMK